MLDPKRGRIPGVHERRDHHVVDPRRHHDDVHEAPPADPRRLAVEEHVPRWGSGGAQDRWTRSVAGERDARATLSATQGAEPSIPKTGGVARRDRTDRVPVLQPHERRRQTARRQRLHDRGRRRWVQVRPSRVGRARDAVEALARQEIQMAHREQIRRVRRRRRGEEDVVGDGSCTLDDGSHRRTVARARRERQTGHPTGRFALPPAAGTPCGSWNDDRRRIRWSEEQERA